MKKSFCFALLFFSFQSFAEYRVYQYYVSSRLKMPEDQKPYLITSTLDPTSYLAYNGGEKSIKIDLLRTWNCPGHTGEKKPICPAPSEILEDQLNPQVNPQDEGNK